MNRFINSNVLILLLISLIAGLIFIPLIGNCPLFDWDEINFAECAREMIVTGNYSQVQINFQPFWEKPPFFIWLQAFSMNIFGINEFAARLPNAICGIFTIVTIYLIGKKFFNHQFGLTWALIHTGTMLPLLYFKSGIIDPWFNYFIFVSIILFVAAFQLNEPKKLLKICIAGIFLGLAVLTKGPAALLIEGVTLLLYLFFSKNLQILVKGQLYFFLLIVLLTSLSWFLFEYVTGNKFIIEQFINYQVRLFETEDSGHSGPIFYHLLVLLIGCFPTSIIFILSLKNNKRISEPQSNLRIVMLILFFVVLIIFSIVKTKIVHYSSLCYYPLTFIAAFGFTHKVFRNSFHATLKILFIIIASLIFIAFAALTQINFLKPYLLKYDLIKDDFAVLNLNAELIFQGYEILIPILFLIAMYFIYQSISTKRHRNFTIGYVLNIIFIISAINTFVPKIELITQHAAIAFYQETAKHDCYVESNKFKSYAYIFYSNRKPEHYQSKSHLDFIKYFNSVQKEGEFLLNYYATANAYWLKTGVIDKPAYLVCKTPQEDNVLEHSDIVKLYTLNGYSFFVRMPQYDK